MCSVSSAVLSLCDPMDCSLPGSSVHGILQARIPEWGAIAFFDPGAYYVINTCEAVVKMRAQNAMT